MQPVQDVAGLQVGMHSCALYLGQDGLLQELAQSHTPLMHASPPAQSLLVQQGSFAPLILQVPPEPHATVQQSLGLQQSPPADTACARLYDGNIDMTKSRIIIERYLLPFRSGCIPERKIPVDKAIDLQKCAGSIVRVLKVLLLCAVSPADIIFSFDKMRLVLTRDPIPWLVASC
jgi:hypothetical protein